MVNSVFESLMKVGLISIQAHCTSQSNDVAILYRYSPVPMIELIMVLTPFSF